MRLQNLKLKIPTVGELTVFLNASERATKPAETERTGTTGFDANHTFYNKSCAYYVYYNYRKNNNNYNDDYYNNNHFYYNYNKKTDYNNSLDSSFRNFQIRSDQSQEV